MPFPSALFQRPVAVMPEAYAPPGFDPQDGVSSLSPRWEGAQGYGAFWGAGAPLGNGDMGALIYGGPENLSLVLGKNDLWLRTTERSYFPGRNFDEMLDLYRRRDLAAYAALQPQDPDWWDRYRPSSLVQGGFLRFHFAEPAAIKGMRQELNLAEGIWSAAFEAQGLDNMWSVSPDFSLESFCSAVDEVLVFQVRRRGRPIRSFTWRLGREAHDRLPPPATDTQGALSWMEQDLAKGDRYAVAILQTGLPVDTTLTGRSVVGECEGAGSEAVWYVAMATTRDAGDPLGLAVDRVEAAAARGGAAIRADQVARWAEFWRRSGIRCSEPAVERARAISMYLTGATLRPGKTSPGLQGMWCRENFPAWSADFHGNINIQAIYQQVLGSNHPELFEPYAALYDGMRPQCERDTASYFGCAGVRYPHAGSIDGHELTEPNYLALAISFMPSSWIARLYWWYYTHTGDREYLRSVGYPVLRDVARFYRGILEKTGLDADGRCRVEPSIWGEHHATEFNAWGTNSSYDIAAMSAGFEQALAAADLLDADAEERAVWRDLLNRLPPLPADAEDVWLYFPEGHPANGRYTWGSFFHAVYPCERASLFHGPDPLRRQALATWRAVAPVGTPNAWCAGVPTVAAILMGDPEWAWASLKTGLPANGLGGGLTQGFFQADHGTGWALGIDAACAFAVNGQILLFGGLPPSVDIAFHSLRVAGPALVSAGRKDGRVTRLVIQALNDGPLCLLNPFRTGDGVVKMSGTDGVRHDWSEAGERAPLRWDARAGIIYEFCAESAQHQETPDHAQSK